MKAGDSVVCVCAERSAGLLTEGQHYIVEKMGAPGFLYVEGVIPYRPGFYVGRFRRVPGTSIAIFTAMLNPKETVNGQQENV